MPAEAWEQVLATFDARWGNPDEPAAIELITPSRVDNVRWKSIVARMQRVSLSPGAARAYMRASMALDIRDVLPAVGVPTAGPAARGRPRLPRSQARWFAEHVEGARYVEVPAVTT